MVAAPVIFSTLVHILARFVVTVQGHAIGALAVGVSRHIDTVMRTTVSFLTFVHVNTFAASVFILVTRLFDKAGQAPALKAALCVEALLVWGASWDGTVALINVQAGLVIWAKVEARGTQAEHNAVAVNALVRTT